MSLVKLKNVSKKYYVKPWKKYVYALKNVVLELDKGVHIIIGSNGSGKSTLLRIIAGVTILDEGEVYVLNKKLYSSDCRDKCISELRRKIGYLPQNLLLLPSLSVIDNVGLPLWIQGIKEWHSKALDILRKLGLTNLKDKKLGDLSIGQRQKVAIGRALVADPDIILLDEPFSHLDREAINIVSKLIRSILIKKLTIITAPKRIDLVTEYKNNIKVYHMYDGKIRLSE